MDKHNPLPEGVTEGEAQGNSQLCLQAKTLLSSSWPDSIEKDNRSSRMEDISVLRGQLAASTPTAWLL